MSSTRAMFLPSVLVSPYNNTMAVNGTARSVSVGTYHHTILDYLSTIQALFAIDAPGFAVSLDVDTGKVTFSSSLNLTITFTDTDIRDMLGFSSTSYAGSKSHTSESAISHAFFPTWPVGYDSGWEDKINKVQQFNDNGVCRSKGVSVETTKDLEVQYTRSEKDSFHAFFRWCSRPYPIAYYPDKTDTSDYDRLLLHPNSTTLLASSQSGKLDMWYSERLKFFKHEGSFSLSGTANFFELLGQPIYNPGIYIRISGVPYIFVQETPHTDTLEWTTPANYTRSNLLSVKQHGIRGVSQKLDIEKGIVKLGSFDIQLQDDVAGTLRNLFARWKANGKVATLATEFSYGALATLVCNESVTSWSASGNLYVGCETMQYSSRAGSTFTISSRDAYSSVQTEGNITENGSYTPVEVSDWPRVWKGRILEVYVYARDMYGRAFDNAYFASGASAFTICYKGIIYDRPSTQDGITWTITANSLNELLNVRIGERMPRGYLMTTGALETAYMYQQKKIRYKGGADVSVSKAPWAAESGVDGGNPLFIVDENNNRLTFRLVSSDGTDEVYQATLYDSAKTDDIALGIYQWDCDDGSEKGLKQVIRETIYQEANGDFADLDQKDINVLKGEDGRCGIYVADSAGAVTFTLTLYNTEYSVLPLLGYFGDVYKSSDMTMWGYSFSIAWSDIAIPAYAITAKTRYIYFIPDENYPDWTLLNTYESVGYAIINDFEVVRFSAVAQVTTLPGGTNQNVWRLDCKDGRGAMGTSAQNIAIDEPVEIKWCMGWENEQFQTILLQVLASRKGDKTNYYSPETANDYDVLKRGGANIDTRLLDITSFELGAQIGVQSNLRNLLIQKSTKLLDLIKQDMLLSMSYLTTRFVGGLLKVSLREMGEYTPAIYTRTLGKDDYTIHRKPEWQRNSTTVINKIVLHTQYDPISDDWIGAVQEFFNDNSIAEYGKVKKVLTIKNMGVIESASNMFDLYADVAKQYFLKHGWKRRRLQMNVLPASLGLEVGDIVLVTCPWLPAADGGYLSADPFIIEQIKPVFYSLGKSEYGASLVLVELDPSSNFRQYNPTAKVKTYTASDAGYSNSPTLELEQNEYTDSNQEDILTSDKYGTIKDIDFFNNTVDFGIEVYNRGEGTYESATVIEVDIANDILVLSSALTMVPSATKCRIRNAQYGSASTKQKKYAYIVSTSTANPHVYS